MTVVALVATIFWVPESPIKAPGHIDPFAVLTLSGWLVACSSASARAASGGGRPRA